MNDNEDLAGTLAEIEQEQPDDTMHMRPVPVVVDGVVPVRHVAARAGSSKNTGVSATEPFKIAKVDPRRRHLMLVSAAAFWVDFGPTGSTGCAAKVCAQWPASVPLPITHLDEVWVMSVAGDIVISTIGENGAD